MSETEEDRAYYQAAEAAFIRRRGTPFLLSPRDFALLKEWRALGVPIEAIEQGIDEAFSRREERSPTGAGASTRSPTAAARFWKPGSAGSETSVGRGGPARAAEPDVTRALRVLAERLRQVSATPAGPRAAARIGAASSLERLEKSPRSAGETEASLARLDKRLAGALYDALPEPDRRRLDAEVEASLARAANPHGRRGGRENREGPDPPHAPRAARPSPPDPPLGRSVILRSEATKIFFTAAEGRSFAFAQDDRNMLRRVTIRTSRRQARASSKTSDGVGFVAGALPGEEVEAEVLEVRKKFWKGRAAAIFSRSPLRLSGTHAEGCAGCDWSHFDVEAALAGQARSLPGNDGADRRGCRPILFGELPIEPSPLAYRLRNRFHSAGRGESTQLGYFLPRTHRVESAGDCEALCESMRAALPRLRDAIAASGAAVAEIATVENLDGGRRLARAALPSGCRPPRRQRGPPGSLRSLRRSLGRQRRGSDPRRAAANGASGSDQGSRFPADGRAPSFRSTGISWRLSPPPSRRRPHPFLPGRALDLFGGVGFFAGALLDAGHEVVTVEANHAAVEQAQAARKRWRRRVLDGPACRRPRVPGQSLGTPSM